MEFKNLGHKPPKVLRNYAIDENLYAEFKAGCKRINISMSSLIGEFILRSTELLKDENGGEVCFGVEGKNWKQPTQIIYDGKEIVERDGIRKIKEGSNSK